VLGSTDANQLKSLQVRCHHSNLNYSERIGIPVENISKIIGILFSALSEVFWQIIEMLLAMRYALVLKFRYDIMEHKRKEFSRALDGLCATICRFHRRY
jgi:hypothetical protein